MSANKGPRTPMQLRMPSSLKQRIKAAAISVGLTMTAYLIQCAEQELHRRAEEKNHAAR